MIKELAFQKGWAGKTISRSETVDRLNPIIREHIVLNRSYDAVIQSIKTKETRQALEDAQKTARVNVSKIAETIYSCGGVAFNGTELEPGDFNLGTGVDALERLEALDNALVDLVVAEDDVEHQMRTRAILGVVADSTRSRLSMLRSEIRRVR